MSAFGDVLCVLDSAAGSDSVTVIVMFKYNNVIQLSIFVLLRCHYCCQIPHCVAQRDANNEDCDESRGSVTQGQLSRALNIIFCRKGVNKRTILLVF
jgi:hypothetical protein